MELNFDAIGLEVPSEKAFNYLAEQAGDQGEATQLLRRGAVLHGRCWKLGQGLEVWTVLYESDTGDTFYADCRPGFRARYTERISPWALTEYVEEGEAIVHGYCDSADAEVLFELQNLTEVAPAGFRARELHVGLCGLAYRARVYNAPSEAGGHIGITAVRAAVAGGAAPPLTRWQPLEKWAPARAAHENDWSLCGRVIAFKSLRNPLSGSELYWAYLDLDCLKLEVLINQRALRGGDLAVGATLTAEVWLQGHIFDQRALLSRYEGIDASSSIADCWARLKRNN